MRYYDIAVTKPGGGGNVIHFTSHPRGNSQSPDPGALQVEMDVFQLPYGVADANSWIKIWGVSLDTISQSKNLTLMNCVVKGGMGKGLPLARPDQANVLAAGQIIQSFGNWVGTDMTLDLILQPGLVSEKKVQEPRDLTYNQPAGKPMKDALSQTLKTGYPNLKLHMGISDDLVLPNDEVGYHSRTAPFAQYINNLSRKIKGAQNYPGVSITILGDTIFVQDGTQQQDVKAISFFDLVGQPTWIGALTLQVTCVMRGDIKVNSYISLPSTPVTTTPAAGAGLSLQKKQTPTFNGKFMVNKIRHVGNYKQPDGRAWVTILDCLFVPSAGYDPNSLGPGYGVPTFDAASGAF